MGNISLVGATSGGTTLVPQATGTYTVTLPAATGTLAITASPTFTGVTTESTITSPSATALTIQSAGTTAMTVDTSQNVGIGTTSPSARLQVSSAASPEITVRSTASASWKSRISFGNTTAPKWEIGADLGDVGNNNFYFYDVLNGIERIRIDSSGNLLVGTTSAYGAGQLQVAGSATAQLSLRNTTSASGKYWKLGPDGGANNMTIYNQSSIGQYMVDGGTSWLAGSDERMKNIIEPISDGLAKVNTLRAIIGSYKNDEEQRRRPFVIAQEVQAVLPEAVDASNPDKLGVSYTDLTPLLIAAIKELSAKNDALEARLAALEAK